MDVSVMLAKQTKATLDAFDRAHRSDPKVPETFSVPAIHGALFNKLVQDVEDSFLTLTQLPITTLIAIVSEFDVLMGCIIAAVLRDKPAILNASQRTLTFEELARFPDVEAARTYLVEKEVESVLRDNHTDQFNWLENRLVIPLRKGLKSWPKFIEITQRRNLFVHTDGIVSSQYLDNCKKHGAPIPSNLKVGEQLKIDAAYFREARDTLLEIGIKLAQVVWRKMRPHEEEAAEGHLTHIGYDLLTRSMNQCVASTLSFFVHDLKWTSGERKLISTINLAQAQKWLKKSDVCSHLLKDIDETILADKFKLAVYVLKDQFGDAADVMRDIGADNGMEAEDYRDWPLFKAFRSSPEFLEAFESIFGRSFGDYVAETKNVRAALQEQAQQALDEELRAKQKPIEDDQPPPGKAGPTLPQGPTEEPPSE